MTHEIEISTAPSGRKKLRFHGIAKQGTVTNVTVSKDTSLTGDTTTGSCTTVDAQLRVSPLRFGALSNPLLPFVILIVTDSAGSVQSCSFNPAMIAA